MFSFVRNCLNKKKSNTNRCKKNIYICGLANLLIFVAAIFECKTPVIKWN